MPVGDVIVYPVHGGTEHLILTVHPQILGGYELGEQLLADLLELLLPAHQEEVVMDVGEGDITQSLNIMIVSKLIDTWHHIIIITVICGKYCFC